MRRAAAGQYLFYAWTGVGIDGEKADDLTSRLADAIGDMLDGVEVGEEGTASP